MNANENEMTLDPPGRIAIIGAGPLGLEAALYGRFLGYDVTVFERGSVGQTLRECVDQPLPMLPSVCLSSLAWSAITAQLGGGDSLPAESLPLTIGQWLEDGLQRLAKTDLLCGRVWTGWELVTIELVESTADQADDASQRGEESPLEDRELEDREVYVDGDVPPDFRLRVRHVDALSAGGRTDRRDGAEEQTLEFEAVILAIGNADATSIAGLDRCQNSPYFFRLGASPADSAAGAAGAAGRGNRSAEQTLRIGWREIVRIFAALGGRAELDLYRPIRL